LGSALNNLEQISDYINHELGAAGFPAPLSLVPAAKFLFNTEADAERYRLESAKIVTCIFAMLQQRQVSQIRQ